MYSTLIKILLAKKNLKKTYKTLGINSLFLDLLGEVTLMINQLNYLIYIFLFKSVEVLYINLSLMQFLKMALYTEMYKSGNLVVLVMI